MKPLTVVLSAVLAFSGSGTLCGQGTISWNNAFGTTTTGVRAPVYGVDPNDPFTPRTGNSPTGLPAGTQTYGGSLLEGTGFTMALFAGATPEAVRANASHVDAATFRTGSSAGFMLGPRLATIPNAAGGTRVYLQFRAWDNQNGSVTSWSQVMANGGIPRGASDEFLSQVLFDPMAVAPGFPTPQTTGVRSSSLYLVPEPSLVALSALAFAALILLRRGQS